MLDIDRSNHMGLWVALRPFTFGLRVAIKGPTDEVENFILKHCCTW